MNCKNWATNSHGHVLVDYRKIPNIGIWFDQSWWIRKKAHLKIQPDLVSRDELLHANMKSCFSNGVTYLEP